MVKTARLLAIATFCFFLVSSASVHAFTMIDQDEAAVVNSSLQDYNGNGRPDGDVVLLTLFRSDKTLSFRTTYTFLLDSYLSDRDTDFKNIYHPGDLIALNNFPMNPYAGLVSDKSGQQYVAFVRQNAQGQIIALSMKIAPAGTDADDKGDKVLQVKNVWKKDRPAGLETLQQDQSIPAAAKEPLADFLGRVNRH